MADSKPLRLTSRQMDVAKFVFSYVKREGISPTLDEIAEALGGVSKITIHEHIGLMEEKGAIMREFYKSRSVRLTPKAEAVVGPLCGGVCPACGRGMNT